jgi:hypothetical protein
MEGGTLHHSFRFLRTLPLLVTTLSMRGDVAELVGVSAVFVLADPPLRALLAFEL